MCKAGGAAQHALDIWLPRESGVRETIDALSSRHPEGFRTVRGDGVEVEVEDIDEEMAEWELRRTAVLKRAKNKMRAVARLLIMSHHLSAHSDPAAELSYKRTGQPS